VKLPIHWLQEFVDAPDDPAEVARRLASCGFAAESIDGEVVDFEVTANRPDCLSVYGLAREAAVAFGRRLKPAPGGLAPDPSGPQPIRVVIDDRACARYALAVAAVTVKASPDWMAARLTAAGVRPINHIVDVTNYVMLEMGHPMHAFDAAKLAGAEIRVRGARDGERITTLDGEARALDPSMLVIADAREAVAVAGVMGGAGSEVSSTTERIALESAWFVPASVRATSKRLGLKTEASARFERGADIEAPVAAIRRALELLAAIESGSPAGAVVDVFPDRPRRRTIRLRPARVARLLGQEVPEEDIQRILSTLGFTVRGAAGGFDVDVPTFRVDVLREADLIEEIGRHWGFDRIPATLPALREAPPPPSSAAVVENSLRQVARAAGCQEAVTFTFIERPAAEPFAAGPDEIVAIQNPLSEKFAVLRPSLLAGLADALVYNRRRESEDVRLFELGSVFHPAAETTRIGWVLSGPRSEHWSGSSGATDFFDAKGVAELLCEAAGIDPSALIAASDDSCPWYVRGRAARLSIDAGGRELILGHVGEIRPAIVAARGLDGSVVVGGELDVAALVRWRDEHAPTGIRPIPRFPSIVRDLSFIVPERLPAADVRGTIRSYAPHTLVAVGEFDRYKGTGVPDGQVSLSMRLTFRDADRTLTDGEVQGAVDAIVQAMGRLHGAVLRGKA
jgi:phenylalanyl-tRNA synthetase beta chain